MAAATSSLSQQLFKLVSEEKDGLSTKEIVAALKPATKLQITTLLYTEFAPKGILHLHGGKWRFLTTDRKLDVAIEKRDRLKVELAEVIALIKTLSISNESEGEAVATTSK